MSRQWYKQMANITWGQYRGNEQKCQVKHFTAKVREHSVAQASLPATLHSVAKASLPATLPEQAGTPALLSEVNGYIFLFTLVSKT